MAPSGTLYTYPDNFRAFKGLISAQFSGAKVDVKSDYPDFVYGDTNKTPAFLKKFPSGEVPAFESADGKVHLAEGNAIAHYLATPQLRGESAEKQAEILQWTNFSEQFLVPSVVTLALHAIGNPVPNNQEKIATEEINKALGVLNTVLGQQKYLVGDQLTLADVVVFADLHSGFTEVFDEATRKQSPNVLKWFEGLAGQQQFKAAVGDLKLCSGAQKGGDHKDNKKDNKKDKKEDKPKEEKPKAEKKKKTKDDDEEEMDAADEALAAEPVQKDPFAALPKGTFDMDEFKRVYSNEDTASVAIPWFWEKFDKENYSIWFGEYKYPKELTQVFMSCNLIAGMYQRLDKMRKQAFASMCLFGTDNNSTISGVWIWRGQELAFSLSPDWMVDYDSYEWKKLDANAPETKKIVNEYLLWEGDFDGKKFNQGKIFK